MRQVANPPNPYASAHAEWLGPPPNVRVNVFEEHARSIIAHNDSPDIPFNWSINPYRGCQHACAYCYARPTHEYLGFGAGTDFDSQIVAKVNAPELLAKKLRSATWTRESICFSGVTDCYQPLEVVYQLTRRCLEVCRDFAQSVSIVTKAYLITRDIDILTAIAAHATVQVFASIPFADDRTARLIEPHAPAPSRRFAAIRALTDAGLRVGVMVAPLIPGLSDREVPAVLQRAADAGATSASYVPLRLPGSVQAVFLERLRAAAPDKAARIEALLAQVRGGRVDEGRFGHRMRGVGEYWRGVQQLFNKTADRYGLRERTPPRPERGVTGREQPTRRRPPPSPPTAPQHRESRRPADQLKRRPGSTQLPLF